ncbi:hypothetical protein HK102_001566 [Quaeritorhiza haematococci]|nr:hypothetical protein HK102_001566 [Quaeritorhiza haematococci]
MAGADIMVGWLSGGKSVVSDRTATSQSLPEPDAVQNIQSVPIPTDVKPPTDHTLVVSFKRPLAGGSGGKNKVLTTGKSESFIWAVGNSAPSTPDNPSSSFGFHDRKGSFSCDFGAVGTGGNAAGAGSGGEAIMASWDPVMTRNAHGFLMFLAWGVFPFIGIFIARYLKDALGVWWYRLHMGLLILGPGLIGFTAFIIIVLVRSSHFNTLHTFLGLLITLLSFAQIALGFVANALWKPTRTSIPWWDQLHWWQGRGLALLALVNLLIGLMVWGVGWGLIVGYIMWVVLGGLALAWGQLKFGQVHHVSGGNSYQLESQKF